MKVVIRGGQIFLHQARMFWQVLSIAGKWAFLVSIVLAALHSYTFRKHEVEKISGRELVSYVYVHIADSFDRIGLNPNSDSSLRFIGFMMLLKITTCEEIGTTQYCLSNLNR